MQLPSSHNFSGHCGASFIDYVQWKNGAGEYIDFANYNGRMEVRVGSGTGALKLLFTTADDSMTVVTDTGGHPMLRLHATDEATRLAGAGSYYYDLLLEHKITSDVTALLKGRLRLEAAITQDEP